VQCIVSELRGVEGGGRKTAEGGGERFRGEGLEGAQFPALNAFGQERGAGDGRSTTTAEEADFADGAVIHDGGELKDVAADGIGDFDLGVGGGKFARIARMLEVFEEDLGVHEMSIAAAGAGRNSGEVRLRGAGTNGGVFRG